ncbi:MAG: response regulator [Proteobacteria bacterium]|nr:response regulator [Pseudomonadota bacterium]MCH8257161.1 response regulator [Pseudomonadota bacterium]
MLGYHEQHKFTGEKVKVEGRDKPLILIVDDQATIIRIMTNMLQPDYAVCVATDGSRAIDVARNQQPDLILLDIIMPGMTGVEACKALKADPITEKIPVIFVTSMDDKHNEEVALKAGAVDYIPKPPSVEIVRARVKVHLSANRHRKFIERLAAGDVSDPEEIKKQAQEILQ